MIEPTWYPNRKQLRQFAFFTLIGFGFLGWLIWQSFGIPLAGQLLLGFAVATFLVGLPFPMAIRPVYVAVMGITLPIGRLMSGLLLWLIYYGALTPIALLFRVIKRDPLQLKRPARGSLWRPYRQPKNISSYYRQA